MVVETTRVGFSDVWEALSAEPALSGWLGVSPRLVTGASCEPPSAALSGSIARVDVDDSAAEIAITTAKQEVVLTVADVSQAGRKDKTKTEISVAPSADPTAELLLADEWQRVLSAAVFLIGESRRRVPRQAVVLLHGIGEQRPGATLEGFAKAIFGDGVGVTPMNFDIETNTTLDPDESDWRDEARPEYWSKPDQVSNMLELRRYQIAQTATRAQTDLFEFYWADKIRDTTLDQVKSWFLGLMLRWHIPARFRLLWILSWLTLLAGAVTAAVLAVGLAGELAKAASDAQDTWEWWKDLSGTTAIGTTVLAAVTGFLRLSVGDAARYLTARPENLSVRSSIREDGLRLLRQLHDCGDYDRVVVVGHSLGSVIGYDLLRLYWSETNERHDSPESVERTALDQYETALQANPAGVDQTGAAGSPSQDTQFELWQESRRNTKPWLITDFVTLGSPLAHASWLLAKDPADLALKQARREVPKCPPLPELARTRRTKAEKLADPSNTKKNRFWWTISYAQTFNAGAGRREMPTLNHGALFAVTRWTNIYYKNNLLLFGDPIGGPVREHFGSGVVDAPFDHNYRPWTHSRYWKGQGDNAAVVLARLKDALYLDARQDLKPLVKYRTIPTEKSAR